MSSNRSIALPLLTKSLFRIGEECETKIRYRLAGYPSSRDEDPYLEFLADGGFMVEALARALFPNGREPEIRPGETPAEATRRELLAGDVDLFEAVFEAEGMHVRADILSRRGNDLELIEVKAASYDSVRDGPIPFRGRRGGIDSAWRPYLLDLAFQTLVVQRSLGPDSVVRPIFCLVDTAKRASQELTFSSIELRSGEEAGFGRPRARFLGDPAAVRRDGLLGFVDASEEVKELLPDVEDKAKSRAGLVRGEGTTATPPIGRRCRDCEYRNPDDPDANRGFLECWGPLGRAKVHFLDLYGLHILDGRQGSGVERLIRDGISELVDIPGELINNGSKTADRQRMQIQCTRLGCPSKHPALVETLRKAPYPLHFVDFETSRMAVPYHAGMRPYEQVAFQFSVHTIERPGGELEHRDWINLEDRYPNFEFARKLRKEIGDSGSMLVWSDHERTALSDIGRAIREQRGNWSRLVQEVGGQLGDSGYGFDEDLAEWLARLVAPAEEKGALARIVDLHDLCREYYVHPRMKGRTSIKAVLPAIWEDDAKLRRDPWFKRYVPEDGRIVSPYDTLRAATADGVKIPAVRDGTGAMRAYQDMMYGRRRGDVAYREACEKLLKEYCRLDTAAMVMIWKHWMSHAEG